MSKYESQYTGAQIDEAVGKALALDDSSSGSENTGSGLYSHAVTIKQKDTTNPVEWLWSVHIKMIDKNSAQVSTDDFVDRLKNALFTSYGAVTTYPADGGSTYCRYQCASILWSTGSHTVNVFNVNYSPNYMPSFTLYDSRITSISDTVNEM